MVHNYTSARRNEKVSSNILQRRKNHVHTDLYDKLCRKYRIELSANKRLNVRSKTNNFRANLKDTKKILSYKHKRYEKDLYWHVKNIETYDTIL